MVVFLVALLVTSIEAQGCFSLPFTNPNLEYAWGARRSDGGRHRGLDFPQPRGAAIRAVADGVIIMRTTTSCFGHVVVVAHADGVFSAYAHMTAPSPLSEGTPVSRLDVIGFVGDSGSCATGPHLHLTMGPSQDSFRGGETWDPYLFIRARRACTLGIPAIVKASRLQEPSMELCAR